MHVSFKTSVSKQTAATSSPSGRITWNLPNNSSFLKCGRNEEAPEVEQINFSITKSITKICGWTNHPESILLSLCFQLSGGGRGLCLRRGGLHRGADSGGSRGEWPGRCQEGSHGGDNSFTVEDGGAGLARCGWMMRDLAWSSRILLVRKWLLNVIECFVERTASPFLMMFPSYWPSLGQRWCCLEWDTTRSHVKV